MNFEQSLQHRALITPFGCSWVENRKESDLALTEDKEINERKKDNEKTKKH